MDPGYGIGVDIYLATPESWATLLLIRTGSREHNIWLCQRAGRMGYRLHADGSGIEIPGDWDEREQRAVMTREVPKTEEEIFLRLAIAGPAGEFPPGIGIPPEQRECLDGRPVWLPKGAAA